MGQKPRVSTARVSSIKDRLAKLLHDLMNEFRTRDAVPLLLILFPAILIVMIPLGPFALLWFWLGFPYGTGSLVLLGIPGFVLLLILAAWDWHDSRKRKRDILKATRIKWRYVLSVFALILILAYYLQRAVNTGFTDYLDARISSLLAVSLSASSSFLLAIDIFAYATYFAVATATFYSPKSVPRMITPVIFSVGLGISAILDAYAEPLRDWITPVLKAVLTLLSLTGFRIRQTGSSLFPPPSILLGRSNSLVVFGFKGSIGLGLNWLGSGFVAIILCSMTIVVFLMKILKAPPKRKFIYAMVGAVGSFFVFLVVNVIGITLIVLYVSYVSLDFYAAYSLGQLAEILFVIWIFFYVLIVLVGEKLLKSRTS